MRVSEQKDCDTSIYVVCEGSSSEPWFIHRFVECVEQRFGKRYSYDVYPTPNTRDDKSNKDNIEDKSRKKGRRKTSGRKMNGEENMDNTSDSKETPKDGNPLYWVRHGREKLKSYSEVFVVFDKDGHPKMKEAFQLAAEPLEDGRTVNVILNSRSFEYYMLLHFEPIYRAFEKTECGEKRNGHTRYFHCCLPKAEAGKACNGDVCINGYARSKGYWIDSKDEHTFVSARNIWLGMKRGEAVRYRALMENPSSEKYNLNPYVEFQELLVRFLNVKILRSGKEIVIDCGRRETQVIARNGNELIIRNGSSVLPLKLDTGWIEYFGYPIENQNFQDFKKSFKSLPEAEDAYAELQFHKECIKKEESLQLAANSSTAITLGELEIDNMFALLHFDNDSYLIF